MIKNQSLKIYKILRLRQRYFVTKTNKPRIRYVLSAFMMFFLSAGLTLSYLESHEPVIQDGVYIAENLSKTGYIRPDTSDSLRALPSNLIDMVRLKGDDKPEKNDLEKSLEVKSGETIAGILQKHGVSGGDAYDTVQALNKHIDVRKIRPGQTFNVKFAPDNGEGKTLAELTMDIDAVKSVHVQKGNDAYTSEIKEKSVQKVTRTGSTQIQTSLYGSAARSGIPPQVIANMIRMYSWSVDFQRDIRRNDTIELLYEVYETEEGEPVKFGDILYANLNLSGIDLALYRYSKSDDDTDYYDAKGHSIKKTLMKTPVDGARISSGYGMRRHPVLGYNKMHKGMDFAAPLGTPVYAAGDGVLEKVGRHGSYGNYIRIRHNGTLKTAYAHLHKFAKGISSGKRVKQGQLIAYIGTTGRSTGPHLHYEVLLNNKQVNPNRVDLPVGERLKGNHLDQFKTYIRKYDQMYVEISKKNNYAYRQDKDDDKKKKPS
jgi:murein DD-endopeptidase MepM/ murein hydrolase activator NlpD